MAHLNNNGLDDPLLSDGMGAFAGQVSAAKASRIQPDECAQMVNLDVTPNGSARTRNGTRQAGTIGGAGSVEGLVFFSTPAATKVLALKEGKLYEADTLDSPTWTEAATGMASGRTEAAQLVDKIYLADGAAVWEWDGTTLTEIVAAPASQLIAAHTSRLFAAGNPAEPDGLAVSDILDGTTWPSPTHRLRIGGGDGDAITALVPWQRDVLIVLKERSAWAVNANPLEEPGNWAIDRIGGNVGCIAGRTAVAAGNDIFFLSRDGVHSLRRSIQQDDLQISLPLSIPVQDVVDRINWAAVETACATFWNNRYLLAVPLDNATEPDTVLVYNTVQQRWSGTWTGWTPTIFGRVDFGTERLVFGNASGQLVVFRDGDSTIFDDDGAPVVPRLLTRAFDFQAVQNPKTPFSVEIDFRNSRDRCDVSLIPDGGRETVLEEDLATAREGISLPIAQLPFDLLAPGSLLRAWGTQHIGQCRELQILIEGAGEDVLEVRGLNANAFLDTLEGDR